MRGEFEDRMDYSPRSSTVERYSPYYEPKMKAGGCLESSVRNPKRGFDVSPDSVQLAKQWLTGKL